tara:strand:+ start:280 stop:696 length:417 start_codon:yes stop_codon:yes gene_type:complete
MILKTFPENNIFVKKISNWYESEPVPISNQPWFINAVVKVSTNRSPEELLYNLHKIENLFGRERSVLNASRTIDLDLIDYEGLIKSDSLILPHPRMHLRLFVLLPMLDIEPNWVHPVLKHSIKELISKYTSNQKIRKL